jgi:hypothetical protein
VVNARVVVQHVNGVDDEGKEREVVLVYEPGRVSALADALRTAEEQATADPTVTPAPRDTDSP